jgi:hypothetical protein
MQARNKLALFRPLPEFLVFCYPAILYGFLSSRPDQTRQIPLVVSRAFGF